MHRHMFFVVLAWVITVFGCGETHQDHRVVGTVTLDNAPLTDATVSFVSRDPSLIGAIARTDENGFYAMAISEDRNGLSAGSYQVRITTFDEGDLEADPPMPEVEERVPSNYNDETELQADVVPGDNKLDFALTSPDKKRR